MSVTVTRRPGQAHSYRRGSRPPGLRALALLVVVVAVAVAAIALSGGGEEAAPATAADARVVGAAGAGTDDVVVLLGPDPAGGEALRVWGVGPGLSQALKGPVAVDASPPPAGPPSRESAAVLGPDSLTVAAQRRPGAVPPPPGTELIRITADDPPATVGQLDGAWTAGSHEDEIGVAMLAPSTGGGFTLTARSFDSSGDEIGSQGTSTVLTSECPQGGGCKPAIESVWPVGGDVYVLIDTPGRGVSLVRQPLGRLDAPATQWTIDLDEATASRVNDSDAVVVGETQGQARALGFSLTTLPLGGGELAEPLEASALPESLTGLVPTAGGVVVASTVDGGTQIESFAYLGSGGDRRALARVEDFGPDEPLELENGRLVAGDDGSFLVAGDVPEATDARVVRISRDGDEEAPE